MIWLAMTICTMGSFWVYESTPGTASAIAAVAPQDSSIRLANDRQTLVVFVHPKCVCTNATLLELSRILQQIDLTAQPKCIFVLRQPAESRSAWMNTPIEQLCRAIPEATVLHDFDGVEARRFGVTTSGTCILYTSNGQRIFCGGITASRGHQGPACGQDLLLQRMTASAADPELCGIEISDQSQDQCPAFGCPLFRPDQVVSAHTDD
jgi:hypothetical protein